VIRTGEIRDAYNLIADEYERVRDQTSSVAPLKMLNARLAPDSRILDIGCGTGLPVSRWLVDQGHRVNGLDISEKMLALARKNVPEADFCVADLALLKPRQFTVDAVTCIFTLFHVRRDLHAEIFGTIRTFLNGRGLFLISTGKVAWEGKEEFLGSTMVWSHFGVETYRSIISASGFEILDEREHPGSDKIDADSHPIFLAQAR